MSEDSIRVTAGRPTSAGAPAPRARGGLPVPSELLVFGLVSLAVLIAGLIDDGLDASTAWAFVTALAFAFILSRGLTKRGTGPDGL